MGIAFSPGCPCCGCTFCKDGAIPQNMQVKYTGIQPGFRDCGCDILNNTFLLPFVDVIGRDTGSDYCLYALTLPGVLCAGGFGAIDVRLQVLLQLSAVNLWTAFVAATIAPDFSIPGIGTFFSTFQQPQDCLNLDLTLTSAVPGEGIAADAQAFLRTGCSLATVAPVPVVMNLKAA